MLKHFHPALFLDEPDLIAGVEMNSPSASEPMASAPPEIVLHVTGAVQSPGVYRLPLGARVADAIEKAGGGTDGADIHRLNLAAKVGDGQQIYVPEFSPPTAPSTTDLRHRPPARGEVNPHAVHALSPGAMSPAQSFASPHMAADGRLIDLNTTTVEQLQTLPRIGPVTARRIVEYRQTYGAFSTVDDLTNVKGIGEKTLAKIRSQITVR